MRPTGPRMNERIRISPVQLIDENGETGRRRRDALRRSAGPGTWASISWRWTADSPSAGLPDHRLRAVQVRAGEEGQGQRKAKTKVSELKEVRLGRSMKIDPHDIGIRMKQAKKFLLEGHKVQIVHAVPRPGDGPSRTRLRPDARASSRTSRSSENLKRIPAWLVVGCQ